MDIDQAQMDLVEWEKLMKTGSCFPCKKQGHMAKDYKTAPKRRHKLRKQILTLFP